MTEIMEMLDMCHPDLWKQACLHCGHVGEVGLDIWTDANGHPACDPCAQRTEHAGR